jgi:Tfp pilus assembly protein PilF
MCLCGCSTSVTNHSPVTRQGMMGVAEERVENRTGDPLGKLSLRELVQRGRACNEEDNTSLAQVYFRAALKRDENSIAAWSGLADTFKQTGDFAKAGELLAVALEKDPENSSLLLALGKMDRRRRKPEQALRRFEQALETDPENSEAMLEMGVTYELLGQPAMARKFLQEAVKMAPDNSAVRNNLGLNYLGQERYADAIREFSRALALGSDSERTRNHLGTAHALQGEEEKALAMFAAATDEAGAYNNLGCVYMNQKKWDAAEKAFKRALDLKPVFYVRAFENLERLKRLRK